MKPASLPDLGTSGTAAPDWFRKTTAGAVTEISDSRAVSPNGQSTTRNNESTIAKKTNGLLLRARGGATIVTVWHISKMNLLSFYYEARHGCFVG